MLAYISPTFVYLTAGPPRFDAALLLLMILTVSYLMDVWVSPIPFRILYMFAAVLINEVFCATASKLILSLFRYPINAPVHHVVTYSHSLSSFSFLMQLVYLEHDSMAVSFSLLWLLLL